MALTLDDERQVVTLAADCGVLRDVSRAADYSAAFSVGSRVAMAVRLERELFMISRLNMELYSSKATQMAHVLINNYKAVLSSDYSPLEMLQAPVFDLLQGTMVDKIRIQLEQHEQTFKMMLQERFDELDTETDNQEKLLQCHKCHSSNVIFDLRQTRSADEGMTAVVSCLKCGAAWKM